MVLQQAEDRQERAKQRIALFRSLFRGREDVYAKRWTSADGRSGYSPAALMDWTAIHSSNPEDRKKVARQTRTFLPLSDAVTRAAIGEGMRALWMRLYKVTDHMASQLSDPDRKVYATLVSNVVDLVDLLPQLNIVGDPNLNALTDQVNKQLCQNSAESLRNSPVTRQQTADSAAAIARTIAGVLAIDQAPTGNVPAAAPAYGPVTASPFSNRDADEAGTDAIMGHMAAYMGGIPA